MTGSSPGRWLGSRTRCPRRTRARATTISSITRRTAASSRVRRVEPRWPAVEARVARTAVTTVSTRTSADIGSRRWIRCRAGHPSLDDPPLARVDRLWIGNVRPGRRQVRRDWRSSRSRRPRSPATPRPTACGWRRRPRPAWRREAYCAPVQARDHDAVTSVVEQRQREALVGPRVLERVESNQADVLDAGLGPMLQLRLDGVDLAQPPANLFHPCDVGLQHVVQRSAAAVAHELPIRRRGRGRRGSTAGSPAPAAPRSRPP